MADVENNNVGTQNTIDTLIHEQGLTFLMKKTTYIKIIRKNASCTAVKAYIYDDATKTLQATATFSGNDATLTTPLAVINAVTYVIVLGNDFNNYQRIYAGGNSFPKSNTDLNFTQGISQETLGNWATSPSTSYNISSIVTGDLPIATSTTKKIGGGWLESEDKIDKNVDLEMPKPLTAEEKILKDLERKAILADPNIPWGN